MTKIEWAPLNIPLRRRMETLTTAVYMFLAFGVCLASHSYYILMLIFGNYYLKAFLIAYGIWIYLQKEKSENEARGSGVRWMRDNFFWKHFRDFFPIELVKTEDLPPTKNYLLACYPHGVAGIGIFTNMVVDISKWNELFPQICPKVATLAFQFSTPFWLHIVKMWGSISVTRKSLYNNLTISHDPNDPINAADGYTASAVAVVVGGAREALDSKPGKYIITIKERKGFIKLAMKAGATIVPVFSFGEVDVFDQLDNPPNSFVRKAQLLVKKITGIAPLIILGRGFFQYNIGMLPQRRRIVQVVGSPIDVPQSDDPDQEVVDKIHQRFMDDLNKLFETHKTKYVSEPEKAVLVMKYWSKSLKTVKIEWAPVNVPPKRRIQTFVAGFYLFLMLGVGLCSHLAFLLLLIFVNYYLKAFLIAYGIWIYLDREKSENEARGSGVRWMRDNFFWKHFRDFFPVELVKTEDLPPTKNYLLACYPHGVAGIGIFTNMVADISKWNELFPQIRPKAATLAFQFSTPFWRHIVKMWGLISVTRKSLYNNLTISHDPNDPINASDGYTASAVAVVVGGAREALDSKPGKYIITIKERKGFIKLAMKSGATIVPVFSFGEVDVFDQLDNPPNSFVRKAQLLVKKITGISPLIILGRGFFQYNIGMLPQRRRIVQVVGSPIDVPQSDDPDQEVVDKIHQRFMDDLNKLFETHKTKYVSEPEKAVLVMK